MVLQEEELGSGTAPPEGGDREEGAVETGPESSSSSSASSSEPEDEADSSSSSSSSSCGEAHSQTSPSQLPMGKNSITELEDGVERQPSQGCDLCRELGDLTLQESVVSRES